MAKYTDGPWEAVGLLVRTKYMGEGGFLVADCARSYLPNPEADARLIAAAPELLEACMKAREWLAGWASAEPYISALDAAIAKATEAQP